MGLLSSSTSITRYRVTGDIQGTVIERVEKGLTENCVPEIQDGASDKFVGWTCFEKPYTPDFKGSSFVYGSYFIFCLRIDRKIIPPKIIQKYIAIESNKKLAKSGRTHLSANERAMIKDHVINLLNARIPATPHIYDLFWDYEQSLVTFFTTLKNANEELETLFFKSFGLSLIRLFPYTTAELSMELPGPQKDRLLKLTPTPFII